MTDVKEPLIGDLVAWCARHPRSYAEVLEAWRTSCPRLTVWEDAVERGLLETRTEGMSQGGSLMVVVTAKGHDLISGGAAEPPRRASGPVAAAARAPVCGR